MKLTIGQVRDFGASSRAQPCRTHILLDVDDGDQVLATDKVFGALVVKIIKGMDSELAEKGTAGFPDLEFSLRAMARVGALTSGFDGGEYTHIIKNYARHILGGRTEEEQRAYKEALKEAYRKYYRALPTDQKENFLNPSGHNENDEDDPMEGVEEGEPWFGQPTAQDANYKIESFPLNGAWKHYKELTKYVISLRSPRESY
jgi:hypothetical protein